MAVAILSGRYSAPIAEAENQYQQGIKPSMFKSLIGKGHPEFSTKRQQDAVEFLLHMINTTEVEDLSLPFKMCLYKLSSHIGNAVHYISGI